MFRIGQKVKINNIKNNCIMKVYEGKVGLVEEVHKEKEDHLYVVRFQEPYMHNVKMAFFQNELIGWY